MAGDPEHAQERWQAALSSPGYRSFLEYMCPGNAKLGVFPPPGTDPEVCPRPILGTWDDHDYGWNNGDRREPGGCVTVWVCLHGVGLEFVAFWHAFVRVVEKCKRN